MIHNGIVINLLSVFVFDHTKSAIMPMNLGHWFVSWTRRQLIDPYLLLHTAILAHGVDLVLRL